MKRSLVIALALFGAGCGQKTEKLTELPPMESAAAQAPTAVSVETLRVTRTTVDRAVFATGTTEPVRAADLGPQITARINAVLVKEGDVVKSGQPLVRLDVSDAEIRVRQAEASAASSKAQYQLASSEYDRMAPLAKQGTVTAQQIERLLGQRDALKAAADAAEIAAENARHVLRDAVVRAPFSGVVSRVPVEVGEVATMMPPTTLVRLVDLSSVKVRMRVHERDMARLKVGDTVMARFPSTGEKMDGTIEYISPEIEPNTRTAEVVTRIPNGEGTLRAGMFAEIQVSAGSTHEGIVIPKTAIGSIASKEFAFVVENDALVQRPIQTLSLDGQRSEVLDGLKEGDVIVVRDVARLSAGQKVKVADAPSGGEP